MRVAVLLVVSARAMSLQAGAKVPKFAATSHTGAAVTSDSLAGSTYCLWFYPMADTGG
jgi:peroxiredoxin